MFQLLSVFPLICAITRIQLFGLLYQVLSSLCRIPIALLSLRGSVTVLSRLCRSLHSLGLLFALACFCRPPSLLAATLCALPAAAALLFVVPAHVLFISSCVTSSDPGVSCLCRSRGAGSHNSPSVPYCSSLFAHCADGLPRLLARLRHEPDAVRSLTLLPTHALLSVLPLPAPHLLSVSPSPALRLRCASLPRCCNAQRHTAACLPQSAE